MDVYRVIVSFLDTKDQPVVSRDFIKAYVMKKWYRLDGLPLLVDIWWHGPSFCHRYCVCRVVGENERVNYYLTREAKRICSIK